MCGDMGGDTGGGDTCHGDGGDACHDDGEGDTGSDTGGGGGGDRDEATPHAPHHSTAILTINVLHSSVEISSSPDMVRGCAGFSRLLVLVLRKS